MGSVPRRGRNWHVTCGTTTWLPKVATLECGPCIELEAGEADPTLKVHMMLVKRKASGSARKAAEDLFHVHLLGTILKQDLNLSWFRPLA